MDIAFVDANLLAAPPPRSIFYLGQLVAARAYHPVFSPHVEREADRHRKPNQRPVAHLREALGWDMVNDHPDIASLGLDDTHPDDRPVIAAAIAADAHFIVTANVRHFGERDLARFGLSAVHPGLFLANRLTADGYREVLAQLAAMRTMPPNDEYAIHVQEVSVELPDLFNAFQDLFGPARSASTKLPPALRFRGVRCVRCGQVPADPASLQYGVGPECATVQIAARGILPDDAASSAAKVSPG